MTSYQGQIWTERDRDRERERGKNMQEGEGAVKKEKKGTKEDMSTEMLLK